MAKFPALMLWTDALIADTYHLSPAEFGAYVRLLMVAWRRPGCNLPDDAAFLAKSAGASPRHWITLGPVVMAFWNKGEDGLLRQKRLSGEHTYATAKRNQRSQAGTASALKRKQTRSTDVEPPLVRPYQHPTHNKKEEDIEPPREEELPSQIETDFDEWYSAYPRKVARAAAFRAYKAARKKIDSTTLMLAIPIYMKNKPDYADWKYPATWLNGECWKDENGPTGKNKPFRM